MVMTATVKAAAIRLGGIKTRCESCHGEVTSRCGNDIVGAVVRFQSSCCSENLTSELVYVQSTDPSTVR